MPLYSYADVALSSSFSMTGLLAVISKKKSPVFKFHLLGPPPAEPAGTDWIHHWQTAAGDISLSLARLGKGYLLRFPSLADFVIDATGFIISVWPASETDGDTLRHLLLDQVMPRVLSSQGRLVLHASAVFVDGGVIAFAGETGLGKSTLAASQHLAGYPLLTDDGLVLKAESDGIQAIPGYAGLRLLPEAAAALFKDSSAGKAMASYSCKNRLALTGNNANEAKELTALFVLTKPNPEEETAISVSPLSQRDACMELVRNSFQLDVTNHEQVTALFAAAAEAAARLPVFALSYPRDYSSLPAVHEVILQHACGAETNNELRTGESDG
jgi:hypothetical protein